MASSTRQHEGSQLETVTRNHLEDDDLFAAIFAATHPPKPFSREDLIKIGKQVLLPPRESWEPDPDDPWPDLADGQILGMVWDRLAG